MIDRACSHAESVSLMRIFSACAEANIREAPMLLAWSKSQRKTQATRINGIAERLAKGAGLDDVLHNSHSVMCEEHVVAIRFGNRLGILPQLTSVILGYSTSLSWRYRALIGYALVMLTIFLGVIGFLAITILPAYAQIINEFGMDSPTSFQWAVAMARCFFVGLLSLPLIFLVAVLLIVSRRLRRWLLLPFQRNERRAAVLELLGVALNEGFSIETAASELLVCMRDLDIKQRLSHVVESQDILPSIGLLTPFEFEQWKTLATPDHQGWFLQAVATQRRERIRRERVVRLEILIPVMVGIMGILVLMESLAIFEPLIQLVKGLS